MGKILRKKRQKLCLKAQSHRERERKNSLIKIISSMKGKYFSGEFTCDLCRHTRLSGYVYIIESEEYEICKYCNDGIFNKKHFGKVIYTPMGNKR